MKTPRIESRIRTDSAEFRDNADAMRAHVATLRQRLALARAGGGEQARTATRTAASSSRAIVSTR